MFKPAGKLAMGVSPQSAATPSSVPEENTVTMATEGAAGPCRLRPGRRGSVQRLLGPPDTCPVAPGGRPLACPHHSRGLKDSGVRAPVGRPRVVSCGSPLRSSDSRGGRCGERALGNNEELMRGFREWKTACLATCLHRGWTPGVSHADASALPAGLEGLRLRRVTVCVTLQQHGGSRAATSGLVSVTGAGAGIAAMDRHRRCQEHLGRRGPSPPAHRRGCPAESLAS